MLQFVGSPFFPIMTKILTFFPSDLKRNLYASYDVTRDDINSSY